MHPTCILSLCTLCKARHKMRISSVDGGSTFILWQVAREVVPCSLGFLILYQPSNKSSSLQSRFPLAIFGYTFKNQILYLIQVTMWRNFIFLHSRHFWKAKISPHDRFFLHKYICGICDKYHVYIVVREDIQMKKNGQLYRPS